VKERLRFPVHPFRGVAFVIEEDSAFRSVDIGLNCDLGTVFDANGVASLVK
jgi:hypothetical protein